jgi:hypothetical protein
MKGLRMFGGRRPVPPEYPPIDEIESAITQICVPGALCYARVWGTNQGLSCELSFNTASATTAGGALEITLREATIELTSPMAAPEWTWNEGLLETAESITSSLEQTNAATQSGTETQTQSRDSKIVGKVKVGFPIGAGVEVGSDIGEGATAESSSARTDTRQAKFTREVRHIKIEKRPASFRVNFSAHPLEDLSDLNTRLTHLPLLDVPEPAVVDLGQISLDLLMSYDPDGEDVRHAFHIRKATGAWRPLKDNPKRALLAELLVSKFLPDLHQAQRLFPKQETS